MSFNASIVDQRLAGIQDEIRERARDELGIADAGRLKSLAFVYLSVKTMLDLDPDDAFDCLTEGGQDFGVDAMRVSEVIDGEFGVTLFQGKYKKDLRGVSNFDETAIRGLITAVRYLFDPGAKLSAINDRLQSKVEDARSLIRDGSIPRVQVIACNNGLRWNGASQELIDAEGFGDQVTWDHVNHDVLVRILQRAKTVDETLRLVGEAIVEDMNYSRVCIGRIPVTEIAELMRRHGDRLLERNIRRYLGLHGNRVNKAIRSTLMSPNPSDFYFFNNGLTLVCNDFSYNALQKSDYQVKVENLQIVNGGQTCMTIYKTDEELRGNRQEPLPGFPNPQKALPDDASVLVRIYKLPKDNEDLVLQITQATNSQNPVDLKDLKSNDEKQQNLGTSIELLGYSYRRKRMEHSAKPNEITSGAAASAILAVWRHAPHQAKFQPRQHFGKLYDSVFTDELNGAQAVAAVLLYRIAENHRRRPTETDPQFVRYASCFIGMQMGRRLLRDLEVKLEQLDHRNFERAKELIETKGEAYFDGAVKDVDHALKLFYGERDTSLQQLSATFRRGDLIAQLLERDLDPI